MPQSVLVVEDDALIASSLLRALAANGFEGRTCGTVSAAIAELDAAPPDLVLLDLGLPDGEGSDVALHAARHHPTVPVIVLTARDAEIDVVLSLEAGAVDYLTKPFRLAELLARISSHLRLRDALLTSRSTGDVIELDGLSIDAAARRVTLDGAEVALRPKEFDVLALLARSVGTVVTREQLIDEVWDENWWGSTKTLDVHINSIRRKLGDEPGSPSRITTVRGIGYRLDPDRAVNRRVLASMLAVTTLAVIAFFVPAAISIRNAQLRQDVLELQREASVVATRLATDGLSEDILRPIDPEHLIGLYGPTGRLVAGDGPDVASDRVTELGLTGAIAEGRLGDSLIAAVPVRLRGGGSAVVRIEAPRSESEGRYARSLLGLAGAGIVILAISGGVAIWLSRRMSRPIEDLRAWAAGADDGQPPDPTGMAEIDGLRDALVSSRTRIDELLRRERSFSSQVSHQLRTPVAAMRVAIETELAVPRADPTEVLHESVGQLDRLESTIASLLALARDTDRQPVECDVDELVSARTADWTPAAERAGRELTPTSSAGRATIDVEAVGHIIDVLVDNAIRHGRGPIVVAASRRPGGLVIDVADGGPTPSTADTFAERGSDSTHGIGLRLARSLAESGNGTLVLLDTPTTTFRLTLPA